MAGATKERRREKTVGFRASPELQTMIKAASEIEGMTISDYYRAQMERVSRRSIRMGGLRIGLLMGGRYEDPVDLAAWTKEKIPKYRAIAWIAAGVDLEKALDLELIDGIFPADYLKAQGTALPEEQTEATAE